ncbi:sugar transferase [Blastococcus jejuensis]|uniref:Sugar transferase n=1 Tax=Blastococcus jejuensis TaxID=351224 RepID=A0ABP6PBX7_9ACTN
MLVDAGAGHAELRPPAPGRLADAVAPVEELPSRAVVGRRRQARWTRRYRAVLITLDVAIGLVAGLAMMLMRPAELTVTSPYAWLSVALPFVWPVALGFRGAYAPKFFGTGSEEFRRVGRGGILLLAAVSVVSYGFQLDIARSFVVFTLPAMTLVTLFARFFARKWLQAARRRGRCIKRVVAVGRDAAVADLVRRIHVDRYAGMEVVAACVTAPGAARVESLGVPIAGDLDDVVAVVQRHDADAVAVTSASETAAIYLRKLSWQLEGSGIELLVSPGLIEIAGPRLHIRPFVGLPLLAIEEPVFSGWKRVLKGALDRCGAALALVLIAPVLLAIAVAVRLSGPGPVLYRQERVGAYGKRYTMYKFRSMVDGADAKLQELLTHNEGAGLLFKMRSDPRVTPVGRWLRRSSLDELPQLLNVLGGSMSLVGPRPPLPQEVERYDTSTRRRLLVKPGLTGLWQISGRSDLSWEESVRLDLRYVENWSLALDLLILWKTASAVLRSRGAY